MRLSGFHTPRWWQAIWRARYPMGVDGSLMVVAKVTGAHHLTYKVRPMPCGCGYCVYRFGDRIGPHKATLGGAIRQARRHAASYAREPQL